MTDQSERLFDLIGMIDDKFITEEQPDKKSRLPLLFSLGGACAAAIAGIFLLRGALPDGGELPYATATSAITASPAGVPDTVLPDDTHSPPDITPPDQALPAVTTAGTTAAGTTEGRIDAYPADGYSVPVEINYDDLPFEYSGGELKKITAGEPESGGMGFEGMQAKTAQELIGSANPWDTSLTIDELPVFRGPGLPPVMDTDKAIARLQKIADALGEELTDIKCNDGGLKDAVDPAMRDLYENKTVDVQAAAGNAKLSIYYKGEITVHIKDPEIPDWWKKDIYSFEMAEKTLLYLAEKYSDLLGYTDWDVETMDYGYANSQVIKHSDDIFEAIMYYNFKRARLLITDNEILMNITDSLDMMECEGMYPTISWREALERVKNREYVTTAPSDVLPDLRNEPERVKAVEMIYRQTSDYAHILPYYRFIVLADPTGYEQWLEEGENFYTAVYVPAIAPEYIADADTGIGFNQ